MSFAITVVVGIFRCEKAVFNKREGTRSQWNAFPNGTRSERC